ncbi:phosphate carrier protein, mitochondrial-like [Pectinophora gossypiella]|uniref:phosphate carrier protein, mitochondrial-like n=1 Tax=Pectinophora gossypiella TaxID=13191 RepID=UPI00214F0D23|nr:phosphate carrier protein, mitochondrial-like [Pectinophora gossypiella]
MGFLFSKPPPKKEEFSCEMYSDKFFALCAAGGALACGLTHTFVTPLDLVKCRLQVDPKKYGSLFKGFGISYNEGGAANLVKGWAPTLFGYSLQGGVKFSGYEFFKYKYASMVDEETAFLKRTYLYLAASASAEMVADVFLAPFEATKVRMQTTPCYTSQMRVAMPLMIHTDGFGVFYRGLLPLWARQVPYTMMKFSSFEKVLEYLYANVVPRPREQCTKAEQLMATFSAGYIAGVLCAIVSHPADMIVSKLNKDPTSSIGGILAEVGMFGIWRGLVARIIMIGTLTGLQWFIYDGFKVYTGMPRPPPPEMPESLKKKMKEQK